MFWRPPSFLSQNSREENARHGALAQLFERFCDCVPQSPRTRVGEEDADQECDRDDSGFLPREKIIHEESLLFSQTPKNKEQQSESWNDVSAEIKEGLMQYVVGRFPPAFDATVSLGRLHGYFGGCEIIALHAILRRECAAGARDWALPDEAPRGLWVRHPRNH